MSNLEPLIKMWVPLLYGTTQREHVWVRYWRNERIVHVEYNWSGWPATLKFIDNLPVAVYTDKWRPYAEHVFVQNRLALYDAKRIVHAPGVYPFGRTSEKALSDSAPVLWWANDMTITAPDSYRGVYFSDKSICGAPPKNQRADFLRDPKIDWHFEDYEYVLLVIIMVIVIAFMTMCAHKGLRGARMSDLNKKINDLGI